LYVVDTVPLVAVEFADGDLVDVGSSFDRTLAGCGEVVVPVWIRRRASLGRNTRDLRHAGIHEAVT